MTTETQQWLDELVKAGSLSEDERKVLIATASKADTFIKDSVLRQSDYSRRQDELRVERDKLTTEYDRKLAEVRKYQEQLAEYDGKSKQELEVANARYVKSVEALATVKAKALANNLTVEELESISSSVTTPSAIPQKQVEQKRALTEDDLPTYMLRMAELYAGLNDLSLRHRKLYNEDLEVGSLLKEAQSSGKNLADYYESKYKPADKERELTEKATNLRIETEVARRLEEWRSQNPLAAPQTEERTGLFDDLKGKPQGTPMAEYESNIAALKVFQQARQERITNERNVFSKY